MNNRRRLELLACAAFTMLLAGCFGGKGPALRSETGQRAETALIRGVRAEHKGNIQEAERFLSEALAASTSIEDLPVRTAALINLARLHRLQQELSKAGPFINRALDLLTAKSALFAEAVHEKALLELARGNAPAALDWALQAIASEQENLVGSRRNLAARIQLELGNFSAADVLARTALNENRAAEQAEEEANSLRIMGIIARDGKKYLEAGQFLQNALAIDKNIGSSSKIAADLEELATTSRLAGNLKESTHYLDRAHDVNLAAGRLRKAQLNQEALAEAYLLLGETLKADKASESARQLGAQIGPQQPTKPSATINPSNKP